MITIPKGRMKISQYGTHSIKSHRIHDTYYIYNKRDQQHKLKESKNQESRNDRTQLVLDIVALHSFSVQFYNF
jgi:hypothetical protein